MPNRLPPDADVLCSLSDAVRTEMGGKVTLLGYFGGNRILADKNSQFPIAITLGITFAFSDGDGTFSAKLRITPPAPHETLAEADLPVIVKDPKRNHTVTVNITPLPMPSFGKYSIELIMDGMSYKRSLILDPQ